MGRFDKFVFSGGAWGAEAAPTLPYLSVDIHDSDIATLDYASSVGTGRCYLGFEPRHYFDDETASDPVDADREAQSLTEWARNVVGRDVNAESVREMLARPDGGDPSDDFVEDTLIRLLRLLGLPLPPDL